MQLPFIGEGSANCAVTREHQWRTDLYLGVRWEKPGYKRRSAGVRAAGFRCAAAAPVRTSCALNVASLLPGVRDLVNRHPGL